MHHHRPSSWTTLPQSFHHHTTFNHVIPSPTEDHHPFNLPPPRSPPLSHGGLFKSMVDGLQPGLDPCKVQTDTVKNMTAQEIADAKSIAASKSHSEAERRRRERINNHLTKLRSLLPNTTKTDKASLLAEVIQHVKELKCQTSMIAERIPVPSEIDELTIDNTSDEEGRIVIRASLCCEDRSNLLQDLIKTLKMLRLKTLKAEITTFGRRVKNVLFVTGADHHPGSSIENQQMVNHWINIIEEALKAIIEKADDGVDSSFMNVKRQKKN